MLPALGKPSLQRAVHDAQARRRDRPQQADHRIRPARVRSSSRRTSGSPATRPSTSRIPNTSRAPSRPRAWPAARSPRSTASSGSLSPTTRQAINALLAGEIDFIEAPPHDLLPLLRRTHNIKRRTSNPLGSQYTLPLQLRRTSRSTMPKIRQALWYAFNQKDFLKAVIGDPEYYKVCKALFICGTPLRRGQGHGGLARAPTSPRPRRC